MEKPLPEAMVAWTTDAYMRHSAPGLWKYTTV